MRAVLKESMFLPESCSSSGELLTRRYFSGEGCGQKSGPIFVISRVLYLKKLWENNWNGGKGRHLDESVDGRGVELSGHVDG